MGLKQSYEDWHNHPKHPHVHWATFISISVIAVFFITNQINLTYNPDFGLGVQTTEAQALPTRLIQQADLIHQGSFTLPDTLNTVGNIGFGYVQGRLAFNPANNSLFMVGHVWDQQVAEISIPALGGVAGVVQTFNDPIEGRGGEINPAVLPRVDYQIGGMWVIGNQLVISTYVYYDGGGTAIYSHFTRSTNLSAAGTLKGPFKVGSGYAGDFAGYFTAVPAEWQSALGGTLLNGACCHAIASLWSWGPAIGTVNPADLLAARNPSPATRLIYYPDTNPYTTRIEQSDFYNGVTEVNGALLVPGTRTILFFGKHGTGFPTYIPGGGPSAPPNRPQVWAFDVNEMIAVKNGTKQTYDVRPYATFAMPGINGDLMAGAAYDPATGRLFITEYAGDGVKARIHVYTIAGTSSTPNPTPTPTPTPTPPPTPVLTPTPSQQTPIGKWNFNEGSGSTTADSSGSNTGTLTNGATWGSGKYGSAISFDGVNDYVNVPNNSGLNIVGDLTFSAWVYHTASGGPDIIASKGGCYNATCPFGLRLASDTLCLDQNNGSSGQETLCPTTTIPLNTWKHIAVTRTGNQIRIYIDGTLQLGPNTYSRTPTANTQPLTIGSIVNATDEGFRGLIDEVKIYNRALTVSEIVTDMNAASVSTPTPTPTPVSGDINNDHIVNSLDWSIMNSKWFTADAASDLNNDGIVNSIDFSVLNNNWLKTW